MVDCFWNPKAEASISIGRLSFQWLNHHCHFNICSRLCIETLKELEAKEHQQISNS
jgi:hypothetical protein